MMRPSRRLAARRQEVLAILEDAGYSNPRIFGSVLRGEDDENSDVDILVDTPRDVSWLRFGGVGVRLEDLLGCPVDLVAASRFKVPWRDQVLAEALPLSTYVK